ncbi:serine hydrolase domain-containing protein [Salinibacterium sp. PAMC 21357]|uniref:serine hydrolase domain-containing protein n=1 Tax=Salinibacterium sp. PAMC 21357 TaxID=1112215 RepID=UPI0002890C64|nr:serine hydrolase domain-containing protein [Salinibacterium sp. PAMC 21357]
MKSDRNSASVITGGRIETRLGAEYRAGALVEWASVTKTVTAATTLAALREVGVQESTRVSELLPDVDIGGRYSVADLLDHTSGLPRVHPGMPSGIFGDPYSGVEDATVFAVLSRDSSSGGTAREYSNLGYAVLGAVIQAITGEGWLEACERLVLKPAGVSSATVSPADADRVLLRGLWGKPREPWGLSGSAYVAAGGLWSTLDDVARFGAFAKSSNPHLRGWERRDDLVWHSGQSRDSGICLLLTDNGAIAAHTIGHIPGAADKLALDLLPADAEEIAVDATRPR